MPSIPAPTYSNSSPNHSKIHSSKMTFFSCCFHHMTISPFKIFIWGSLCNLHYGETPRLSLCIVLLLPPSFFSRFKLSLFWVHDPTNVKHIYAQLKGVKYLSCWNRLLLKVPNSVWIPPTFLSTLPILKFSLFIPSYFEWFFPFGLPSCFFLLVVLCNTWTINPLGNDAVVSDFVQESPWLISVKNQTLDCSVKMVY